MRVVLEITNGQLAGKRIRLGAFQSMSLGRTEWADFSVASDGRMSGEHFSVTCDNQTCRIKDLGSSNGTFVNEQQVTETVLNNGDQIRAGQTVFTVSIEQTTISADESPGNLPSSTAETVPQSPGQSAAPSMTPPPASPPVASQSPAPPESGDSRANSSAHRNDTNRPSIENAPTYLGYGELPPGIVPDGPPAVPSVSTSDYGELPPEVFSADRPAPDRTPLPETPRPATDAPVYGVGGYAGYEVAASESPAGTPASTDSFAGYGELPPGVEIPTSAPSHRPDPPAPQPVPGDFGELPPGVAPTQNTSPASPAAPTERPREVAPPQTAIEKPKKTVPAQPLGGAAPVVLSSGGKPRFTAERCMSELSLFRSVGEAISPIDVAMGLAAKLPMYLLIDFAKHGGTVDRELAAESYLFDWLPVEVAVKASPLLLSAQEVPECAELLQEGWDKDAVICWYSPLDKPALLNHLRSSARLKNQADEKDGGGGDAMLGICWPSVLSPLLSFWSPEFVKKLTKRIDAIFMEIPDIDAQWQIHATQDFKKSLQGLGFAEESLEEADVADGTSGP